ncbi:hypothetical protein G4B88_004959 [Cannabis sativa]|uniref:Uncharacterized protein n=1 Tax=Cannabis sativa TaxID=3483 RepID=A0A7J6FZM0_CANSA|nr:hypothetical protein G4B88_004959 [Cannabis sativa]
MLWRNHPSIPSIQPLLSETSLSIVDSETSLSTTHSDHLLRNLALHNIPQNLYAKVQSKRHFVLGASILPKPDLQSLAPIPHHFLRMRYPKLRYTFMRIIVPSISLSEVAGNYSFSAFHSRHSNLSLNVEVITKEDLVENIENIGSSAAAVLCKISRKVPFTTRILPFNYTKP